MATDNYVGSTAAYEDGNGTGQSMGTPAPSMFHAWLIVVGSLILLWVLGGVVFKSVRI